MRILADSLKASAGFGVASLLIFFSFFLIVIAYTFARRNQKKFERASHLPLDDRMPRGDSNE